LKLISEKKDVDGLSPTNLGKLWQYQHVISAATPAGVMRILKEVTESNLSGKNVVIINDSNIVGKPLGAMLLREKATITFCTENTKDLSFYTKNADIIITATGVPGLINASIIKEGVIIIDVGIKRKDGIILGDVDINTCKGVASLITPVPGGVGPVTVAMLLKNLVDLSSEK
jgi:methylenetetrahydrofolate dehydrogenase (NADP+)/methenyltetrahydrofolate cyclohydrolase